MRMKKIVLAVSLLVVAAVAFSTVYAVSMKAADPVNKQCPVAKKDIKKDGPTSTVKVKDKEYVVGFCCDNCKGKFDGEKEPLKKYPVKEIK
jgi:hypothetical protein